MVDVDNFWSTSWTRVAPCDFESCWRARFPATRSGRRVDVQCDSGRLRVRVSGFGLSLSIFYVQRNPSPFLADDDSVVSD